MRIITIPQGVQGLNKTLTELSTVLEHCTQYIIAYIIIYSRTKYTALLNIKNPI